MQILTSALLAAALLAGQTLAASLLAREDQYCGSENFNPSNNPYSIDSCTDLGHNAYKCASGALVAIKPSHIVLWARKADSKVVVACGPNGDFATLYHCKAGHSQSFSSDCYEERIHFVENASLP